MYIVWKPFYFDISSASIIPEKEYGKYLKIFLNVLWLPTNIKLYISHPLRVKNHDFKGIITSKS